MVSSTGTKDLQHFFFLQRKKLTYNVISVKKGYFFYIWWTPNIILKAKRTTILKFIIFNKRFKKKLYQFVLKFSHIIVKSLIEIHLATNTKFLFLPWPKSFFYQIKSQQKVACQKKILKNLNSKNCKNIKQAYHCV